MRILRTSPTVAGFAALLAVTGCGTRDRRFGTVCDVSGTATLFDPVAGQWKNVQPGTAVGYGDSLRTAGVSAVEVSFDAGAIRIEGNSLVTVDPPFDSAGTSVLVVRNHAGSVFSDLSGLKNGNRYRVVTNTAAADVKGTQFIVRFDPVWARTEVQVLRGTVQVRHAQRFGPPVVCEPGFYTTVHLYTPPAMPLHLTHGHFRQMVTIVGPGRHRKLAAAYMVRPGAVDLNAPLIPGPGFMRKPGAGRALADMGKDLLRPVIRPVKPAPGKGGSKKGGKMKVRDRR